MPLIIIICKRRSCCNIICRKLGERSRSVNSSDDCSRSSHICDNTTHSNSWSSVVTFFKKYIWGGWSCSRMLKPHTDIKSCCSTIKTRIVITSSISICVRTKIPGIAKTYSFTTHSRNPQRESPFIAHISIIKTCILGKCTTWIIEW